MLVMVCLLAALLVAMLFTWVVNLVPARIGARSLSVALVALTCLSVVDQASAGTGVGVSSLRGRGRGRVVARNRVRVRAPIVRRIHVAPIRQFVYAPQAIRFAPLVQRYSPVIQQEVAADCYATPAPVQQIIQADTAVDGCYGGGGVQAIVAQPAYGVAPFAGNLLRGVGRFVFGNRFFGGALRGRALVRAPVRRR